MENMIGSKCAGGMSPNSPNVNCRGIIIPMTISIGGWIPSNSSLQSSCNVSMEMDFVSTSGPSLGFPCFWKISLRELFLRV
jgi:hypothetical protein